MFDELYSKWIKVKETNKEEAEKIYQRMINLGIPLIRIWEFDLKNRPKWVVKQIKQFKKDHSFK